MIKISARRCLMNIDRMSLQSLLSGQMSLCCLLSYLWQKKTEEKDLAVERTPVSSYSDVSDNEPIALWAFRIKLTNYTWIKSKNVIN